jgi:uncharacterized membrane protein
VLALSSFLMVPLGCGDDNGSDNAGGAQQHAGEGAGAQAGAGASSAPEWCSVARVLEAKCWRCHSDPPQHGAPFPLVSYADTQREVMGVPRWERMRSVIEADFMPPDFIELDPPVEKLSAEEKATLLDWFAASAPLRGDSTCE